MALDVSDNDQTRRQQPITDHPPLSVVLAHILKLVRRPGKDLCRVLKIQASFIESLTAFCLIAGYLHAINCIDNNSRSQGPIRGAFGLDIFP